MFSLYRKLQTAIAKLDALDRASAVVEFSPGGEILSVNSSFLALVGYSAEELQGAHHRLLVDPNEAQGEEYLLFWEKIVRGEPVSGEFKRLRKDGAKVFLRGVYSPVLDRKGQVIGVLKLAQDVTAEKLAIAEVAAKFDAIAKIQGVVEFAPDGTILAMNETLLKIFDYQLADVVGKPHALLVEPDYAESDDYQIFWQKLRAGETTAGTFRRVGREGKAVLLHGSYNPIRDIDGHIVKIFKAAKDLTDLLMIGDGLAAVAIGDLTCRIDTPFASDFESVRNDFNSTIDAMSSILRRIFETIIIFGDAAERIATASDSLASRTEDQAANLEEAAAALDEVAATVNLTSANANRADEAVERAKSDAMKGGDVVGRAIEAMGRIQKSSSEIGSIIGVVDEIAFQTNLLALNAGVEAARAGEAGRGFAVVAAEVRMLAQRCTEAARQIKALVATSASDVAAGVKLVRETGDSLNVIANQVLEINQLMGEITNSAKEESVILAEVNSTVSLIDEGTQANSAMAEEAANSVKSLKVQIDTLLGAVNEFRLSDGGLSQMAAESAAADAQAA